MGDVYLTSVNVASAAFEKNYAAMSALVADLNEKLIEMSNEGRASSIARHKKRGKLTARERLQVLRIILFLFFLFYF